jgi:cytidine deaminase
MRTTHWKITITECTIDELSAEDQSLIRKAEAACNHAYAPYSRFHVGAAIRMENGTIVLGSNQENAAYPSGLCAERTAVFAAGANYPAETIVSLAIAARWADGSAYQPISPCGACRQSVLEYEVRQQTPIRLLMRGPEDKVFVIPAMADLLPLQFSGKDLISRRE